ncbi:MAG: aromatic amino acid lyase, partial [Myxococcota bacterium]
MRAEPTPAIALGGPRALTLPELEDLALGRARMVLADAARARAEASARKVEAALAGGPPVYGITTGFGASVSNDVPREAAWETAANLFRYHGCGVGEPLSVVESSAVMVARAASLSRGFSGVRPVLLERLFAVHAAGVRPVIPALGSVGASGDLTPLSYLAALLAGEREAWLEGRPMEAAEALRARGLAPLVLAPKESLAIMNGTSVMTALGG